MLKRRYLSIFVIVLFASLFALSWLLVRHRALRRIQQLDELARRGSGFGADVGNVEQLGQNNDSYANALLFRIADDPETNPGARIIALSYLAKHRAPFSTEIASLVIPQEAIAVRKAAVKALFQLNCSEQCVREILHYEERLFHGEPPAENLFLTFPSGKIKDDVQAEEAQLNQEIWLLLKANEKTAVPVLVRTYGLGGIGPAKFALLAAQNMPQASVCALLRQSEVDRSSILGKSNDELSLSLTSAINKHCDEKPGGSPAGTKHN